MGKPAEESQTAVALEFEDFRTFLNSFSANVSQGGMFVEASEPQPPGTEIEFDLKLEGGESLIRGRGEVAWVAEGGGAEPAGMGIRFVDLDPESEGLIERIVDIRTKAGRKLFDVEQGATPELASATTEDAVADLLRAQLESLKQERTEEQKQWQVELKTVTEARDQLAEQLRELEGDRARLEQAVEVQATEIARRTERSVGASSERDKLAKEKQALGEQTEAAEARAAQLEQKVEEQTADIARFSEQGKYAMAERERMDSARKALAEQLEAALAEAERLTAEGEAAIDLTKELEEVKGSLAEVQAVEEALREQLSEARSTVERLEQEAGEKESSLRAEVDEAVTSRDELIESLELGQSELDDVRRRFEESAERNLELERETSSLGSQLAETRERAEGLESETASIRAEMEELRSQRGALEAELVLQTKVARRAKKLSERVRAEHLSLQEDLAEVQARLEELQGETGQVAGTAAGAEGSPADGMQMYGAEHEIPAGEDAEGHRQSGLWAAITRTLGKPLLKDDEMTEGDAVTTEADATDEAFEAAAEEIEPQPRDASEESEDSAVASESKSESGSSAAEQVA